MSVPFSTTKLRLPAGFNALIHGFCYEILKSQPEDIHAFGDSYFTSLLDAREGRKINKEIKDSEYHVNQQQNVPRENPQSKAENVEDLVEKDEMSEKQMTNDGKVAEEKRLAEGHDDDDVVDEVDVEASTQTNPRLGVEEVVDIDLEDPEVKKAATLIQSGFMGRMARKKMAAKQQNNEPPTSMRTSEEKHTKPEEEVGNIISVSAKSGDRNGKKWKNHDEAAKKIQAGVRGMMVRRNMRPEEKDGQQRKKEVRVNSGDDNRSSGTKIEEYDDDDDDDDEEAINYDGKMEETRKKAATKIQSGVRGMQTRRKIKEKKEAGLSPLTRRGDGDTLQKHDAVSKIQDGYKGMKTRQHVRQTKLDAVDGRRDEDNNKSIEPADDDDRNELVNKSATKIQAGLRGMKTRKELKDKRNKIQRSLSLNQAETSSICHDDMDKAATKIQAGLRGMQVRRNIKKQNSEGGEMMAGNLHRDFTRDRNIDEINRAADKIQAGARGMKVRTDIKRRMSEGGGGEGERDDFDRLEKDKAAATIQAGVRGMKTRREMKNRRQMTLDDTNFETLQEEKDKAAATIQAGVRGMKTRREMKNRRQMTLDDTNFETLQEEEETPSLDELRSKAATKIQAGVRGMQTRRDVKSRGSTGDVDDSITPIRELKDNSKKVDPGEAATKIQAGVRGMKARRDLKKKREEINPERPPLRQFGQSSVDVDRAATTIQAGVRGMRTRKNLELQKASWKTFDSDALGSTDFE